MRHQERVASIYEVRMEQNLAAEENDMKFCNTCRKWYDSTRKHWCTGTPDDGHLFRFSVTGTMSSKTVGDAHHTDADWEAEPWELEVRAWSLPAALRVAADAPLYAWKMPPEPEEEP